jgi:hypothetical protein
MSTTDSMSYSSPTMMTAQALESLKAGGVSVIGVGAGSALLLTKWHTCHVRLAVAYAEAEPASDSSNDDIVEIDFMAGAPSLYLAAWAHVQEFELPNLPAEPGNYRLRYHAVRLGPGTGADGH